MSDFISELEAELLAAARRRATRSRGRRFVARVRPATVLAIVTVAALLVAAVAVVRGLETAQPGGEIPAPPPGQGVALALPAADAARPCPTRLVRSLAGNAPQPVPLRIFARPQTEPDGVPAVNGADSFAWIPADVLFVGASRRPTSDRFEKELHLVPVSGLRPGGCDGKSADNGLGVCLTVGAGDVVVRCFSDPEIDAGRALALTSPGFVHGIAPDGAVTVTLQWAGGSTTAPVLENAYELRVPVSAGDRVRVSFEVVEQCAPSPQALDAVPALREGALQALPQATEESLPTGGRPQWSRRLEGGDGLELWAVAHCSEAGRICVLGIYDGRWTAQPCGSPSQIRRRGVWWTFPVAGRLGVAGLALEGTRRVEVVHDGKRVHELPLTGGVFGGLLPPAFGSSVDPGEGDASRRLEVRFRR